MTPGNCMICGEWKEEGLTIVNRFLCLTCERELVRTEVDEARYAFFVRQMRQLELRL